METFYKRIADLRKEELASIKTVLQNNNLSEINISEVSEPTHVFWFDNDGFIHEGKVLRVNWPGKELSLSVETEDSCITVYEDDFAFENVTWLAGIYSNILEVLSQQ